jgi:hypothetical protein
MQELLDKIESLELILTSIVEQLYLLRKEIEEKKHE